MDPVQPLFNPIILSFDHGPCQLPPIFSIVGTSAGWSDVVFLALSCPCTGPVGLQGKMCWPEACVAASHSRVLA